MDKDLGAARAALVVVVSTAAAGAVLVGQPSTAATSTTVSENPSPTYQTNGRVDAIVTVGSTVYIGGNFTQVRPAGSPPGTDTVPRSRLAAFSAATGALLPWNPGANSTVNALAASPNGRTIYVGGRFGRLGQKARKNLGAVSAATGNVKGFRADTDRRVLALAAAKKRLFVGGKLSRIDGVPRSHLAALSRRGHVLRNWRPGVDGFVRALALSPGGKSLFIGGDFKHLRGKKQLHLAKVGTKRGVLRPFGRHPKYPVIELAATKHRLYLAGNGAGGHVASYSVRGAFKWVRQVDGAAHSLAKLKGVVYLGGQFAHVCVGNTSHPTTGFNCPTDLAERRRLAAFATSDGAVLAWNPTTDSIDGVFAVAKVGSHVQIGGDFTTVHGVDQQSYADFAP